MNSPIDQVTVCRECGMMYMKTLKKDVQTHRKAHDLAMNGLKVTKDVLFRTVILEVENVRIAAVSHNRGRKKEKLLAQEIAITAKRATDRKSAFTWFRYDVAMPVNDLDYHIFLYVIDKRAVGMLTMCLRPNAMFGEWSAKTGKMEGDPRWCVEMVWVAHNWRRHGIARYLVNEAASYLQTTAKLVAWASPFSESGKALVQYFCPERFYYR